MTATNHALSGAIIGAILPLPIAIPVAFGSHFVLDMLPHYGIPHNQRNKNPIFKLIVFSDTIIALTIAATAVAFRRWDMEIVGWVAYSPDATWVLHYYKQGKNLYIKPKNWFMRFHKSIQRFERPWGIWVDIAASMIMFPIYFQLLSK
jgi:hypothetical protein